MTLYASQDFGVWGVKCEKNCLYQSSDGLDCSFFTKAKFLYLMKDFSKMKKVFFLIMVSFLSMYAFGIKAADVTVVMNVKTYIYHNPDCKWARRCTKNCIKTTIEQAKAQGARACKVCGG